MCICVMSIYMCIYMIHIYIYMWIDTQLTVLYQYMPCYAVLHHDIPYYTMLCHTILCHKNYCYSTTAISSAIASLSGDRSRERRRQGDVR